MSFHVAHESTVVGCATNPGDLENNMLMRVMRFVSSLYLLLRGPVEVITERTNFLYEKTHVRGDGEVKLNVTCQQFIHRVKYAMWYIPNKNHYTYEVDVVLTRDEEVHCLPTAQYPLLCSRLFLNGKLPYVFAVNAYMDSILNLDCVKAVMGRS